MRRIVGGRIASAVAVFIMLAAGLPAVTGGPSSAGAVTATSDVAARAGLAPGPVPYATCHVQPVM